ncbi:MAG TPA: hypothetical protein VLS89_05210 [Candidatus Nanopelagicales bacterium]|nr:hypothetical protein [Candidatus Nanopelagicales bacterium]
MSTRAVIGSASPKLVIVIPKELPVLRLLLVELNRFMTKLERVAATGLSARPWPW